MSGIYGLARFRGGPPEPGTALAMGKAMAYYGPDGGGCVDLGMAALGHLLLASTPEDAFERQPIHEDGVLLVTAARLDNREELLEAFALPPELHATLPDGRLVFLAYRRWGRACPGHLKGDWALAAWDEREHSLFLARDPLGNTALYYHSRPDGLAFASSLKALRTLPGVSRAPDLERLAQVLVVWQHDPGLTAFEAFKRLPGGYALRADAGGVRLDRYWEPGEGGSLRLSREEDCLEAFREAYGRAVRVRLRSTRPIAATLSGGLDSGSVVALAAPMLAEEGRSLRTFTAVPAFPPGPVAPRRLGDEWEAAQATARMAGPNVHPVPIDARDQGFLDSLRRLLEIHDGPLHGAGNFHWLEAIFQATARAGCGVLLTGQFGNASVSWAGHGSPARALLNGDLPGALGILVRGERSAAATLRHGILRPLLWPLLRLLRTPRGQAAPWSRYSAIHPAFSARLDLARRMALAGHDPFFRGSPFRDARRALFGASWGDSAAAWHEAGAWHGLDIRDPTADQDLVERCLAFPDWIFRRRGEGRWLLRRAMAGRMPEAVLNSRQSGLQAADLRARILAEKEEIHQLLERFQGDLRIGNCLDLPDLHRRLAGLAAGNEPADATPLARALLVGLGLKNLDDTLIPLNASHPPEIKES